MTTRKLSTKQPKPESQYTATEPDLEDLIVKQIKAMQDAKNLKNNEKHESLLPKLFNCLTLIHRYQLINTTYPNLLRI